MQANIESEITEGEFSPLPPIHETSLSSNQMQVMQTYFNQLLNGQSFCVMMLCRQTEALKVGEFVLGAQVTLNPRLYWLIDQVK